MNRRGLPLSKNARYTRALRGIRGHDLHNQYTNMNSALVVAEGTDVRTFHIYDVAHTYIGDITISVSVYGFDLLDRIADLTPDLYRDRRYLAVVWMNPDRSSHGVLDRDARLRDQNLADDLTVITNFQLPPDLLSNNNSNNNSTSGGRRKKTHRKRKHLKRKHLKRKTHRKH